MPSQLASSSVRWSAAVLAATVSLAARAHEGGAASIEAEGSSLECLEGRLERSEGRTFDAATGRDPRNYPPDRVVDFVKMTLDLAFADLDAKRFEGRETLAVRGFGAPVTKLELDAVGLDVHAVSRDGRPTPFFIDDEHLTITLDPALAAGEEASLGIDYACVDPRSGMIFTPSNPGDPARGAEVHTQGEPEQNRNWFACHDSPNERLATELVVHVPDGYLVSSNGRLVEQSTLDGVSTWRWLQERPHANYLVSLVIGRFDRVDLKPGARGVPMTVWAPPGLPDVAERVERTYGRTGRMMDLFERRFGVPYAWARYDQVLARNFGAGGMENTSVTTLQPGALLDAAAELDGDYDGLISHELGHQWFGDLVTCRSWAHLWLNEGWATYASALWAEEREGRDAYLDSIRGSFAVADRDTTTNLIGMVSNEYGSPGETFGRAANPYSKGSSILHMLRTMLGEDLFWTGVHRYVQARQDTVAETDDLRHALEEVSGRDLEWFFDQWCVRPGTPRLKVKVGFDAPRSEVVVDVAQTQSIDARTPAFRFDLPIWVMTEHGPRTFVVPMRDKTATLRVAVEGTPSMIVVDPELAVLKKVELDAPLPLLLAQAEKGPTIAARRAAVDAIADQDRPEVVATLERVARDAARRHSERAGALAALGRFGSNDAKARVRAFLDEGIDDARIRVVGIDAAPRTLEREAAVALLTKVATSDPSYDCRVSAVNGLAGLKAMEAKDAILALVDAPSHNDKVKLAALDALAALDDERALAKAIEASRFGNPDRARPRAIGVVGKLAKHDMDGAVAALVALLDDPERRSVGAAGEALSDLKAPAARDRIAAMAASGPEGLRESAARWLKKYTG